VETLEAHRTFFAELITAIAGVPKSRPTSAFAATPSGALSRPRSMEGFYWPWIHTDSVRGSRFSISRRCRCTGGGTRD
jgi:hypothetical protein